MFRALTAAVAATLLLAGSAVAQTTAPEMPPLSAYAALPAVQSVAVSPDGTNLAYIRRDADGVQVITQARTGELLKAVNVGESLVRGVFWVSNDHVFISSTSSQNLGGFRGRGEFGIGDILNVRTGGLVRALNDADFSVYNIVYGADRVTRNGRPGLVVSGITTDRAAYTLDLYAVDLDSGRGRRIVIGQNDTRQYIVGADGTPLARSSYQDENGLWRLAVPGGLGWTDVHSERALIDTPSAMGVGRTPGTLLIREQGEAGEGILTEIDVATRARTDIELPGSVNSVEQAYDGHLVGFGYMDVFQKYQFTEPKLQRAWDTVSSALPGRQLTVASFSDDFDEVIFHVTGSGEPGGYFLFDGVANKLSRVGRQYPGVAPGQMAEVRVVRFKAADGLDMVGYLTLPPGREARNLPLVMFPHGGPAAHDEPGFDWWAQAMASRGYAVFQPNFRGSTGSGPAFLQAGYGEWGRKMQSDLSDGLEALVDQGVVDPARVCIVGASYGGYAAMAGMTLDAGTYRCGVAVAGVSDLRAMLQSEETQGGSRGERNSTIRYWKRFMGFDTLNDPSLTERSPAQQASRLQGPLLLIHGRNDIVVPYDQSELMLRAAERVPGSQVRLVPLAGEDHYLSSPATRAQMLNELGSFLEANNPPN